MRGGRPRDVLLVKRRVAAEEAGLRGQDAGQDDQNDNSQNDETGPG
jgi:hypothetical protein